LRDGLFSSFLVHVAVRSHTRELLTARLPEIFMRVNLTAGFVLKAESPPVGKDRIVYWDEKRPGFGLMITANGNRSFVFQYRNNAGESRRASLSGTTKLGDAHKWADILQGEIAKGADPVQRKRAEKVEQSKRGKFRTIAEEYLKREGHKIRSLPQRKVILTRLVYPEILVKIDG
jgi:hypothetical protein